MIPKGLRAESNLLFNSSGTKMAESRRKQIEKLTIEAFCHFGHTSHSSRANTLPAVINFCETEMINYTLNASPGEGYFIEANLSIPELREKLKAWAKKGK